MCLPSLPQRPSAAAPSPLPLPAYAVLVTQDEQQRLKDKLAAAERALEELRDAQARSTRDLEAQLAAAQAEAAAARAERDALQRAQEAAERGSSRLMEVGVVRLPQVCRVCVCRCGCVHACIGVWLCVQVAACRG